MFQGKKLFTLFSNLGTLSSLDWPVCNTSALDSSSWSLGLIPQKHCCLPLRGRHRIHKSIKQVGFSLFRVYFPTKVLRTEGSLNGLSFFCLAQVVAERLFSPPDSPALPRDKPKRSSRTLGPEEAIPKNVVTPSHPQLLNMAAQLLEQAEGVVESTGTGQVAWISWGSSSQQRSWEGGLHCILLCISKCKVILPTWGVFPWSWDVGQDSDSLVVCPWAWG